MRNSIYAALCPHLCVLLRKSAASKMASQLAASTAAVPPYCGLHYEETDRPRPAAHCTMLLYAALATLATPHNR